MKMVPSDPLSEGNWTGYKYGKHCHDATCSFFPKIYFFAYNSLCSRVSRTGFKGIEDCSDRIMVVRMRQETVTNFTEKEEEFANLLIEIGIKKNIAKVLVFLAKTPEATSRAIECGTDMRQPEISMAMKYLMDRGWIRSRENPSENKGRPNKIYELAKPIHEIIDCIENEKKIEASNKLALVQKLREHLR